MVQPLHRHRSSSVRRPSHAIRRKRQWKRSRSFLREKNSMCRYPRHRPRVIAGFSRVQLERSVLRWNHPTAGRERLAALALTFGAFALPRPEPVRLCWSTDDRGNQALNRRELSPCKSASGHQRHCFLALLSASSPSSRPTSWVPFFFRFRRPQPAGSSRNRLKGWAPSGIDTGW